MVTRESHLPGFRPSGSSPSQSKRVLITGASGFLGSAVATVFRNSGYTVRAMARATSPRSNLSPHDEIAEGDLRDRASLARALAQTDCLVHVAADYRLWVPAPDEMVRTNVDGTRALMEEALRAGVERIVYTSSVATLALREDGVSVDERSPADPQKVIGAYKRSKTLAEHAVLEMIERDGLPAVIVMPSTPIGPRDIKPTPTGRIIVEAASGRMPGYVDTGLNLAHVDDIAAGHLAAMRRGVIGERYILGGENVALSAMLEDIAVMVNGRPPFFKVPRAAIYPLAIVAETMARFTGREPFVTRDGLRMSRYRMYFSDAKARRDLGYTSRPYREGIADAIAWFRANGYVR